VNQLKQGVVLSYVSMVIQIFVGLLYIPILVSALTIKEYGLYQLIGSFAAYLAVMDFGLSGTITRYYSQKLALNDKNGQENVLAVSLIIYGIISLLVGLVGYFLVANVQNIFKNSLDISQIASAKTMLVLLVFNVMLTLPGHVYSATITSHEKFVFPRIVKILQTVTQPFVVIAILRFKASAISVVCVQVSFNVVVLFLNYAYSHWGLKVIIKLHKFDSSLVLSMLRFSFFIFLNVIVDQLYWKTDSLILGIIFDTSVVAVYSIASQIVGYYTSLSTAVSSVFLPRLSRLATKSNSLGEINTLFLKNGRIQFELLGLILTGFIVFGKPFIALLAGKAFLPAYAMVLVVMIPLTIPLIQNTGIYVLQAMNKHAFRSVVYLVMAVANVLISIPMAKRFGGLGCASVTGVCMLLGNGFIINYYYSHVIHLDVWGFWKQILRLSIPVVVSLVIGMFVFYSMTIHSWFILVAYIFLYVVIFFVLLWLGGFNDYEKGLIRSIVRRLKIKKFK
jgi:O-antigen/teichoic acid export membrane protein